MKRSFIRCLWGDYQEKSKNAFYFENLSKNGFSVPTEYHMARRTKMDSDINKCLAMPFIEPFVTYVFGEENFESLKKLKIDCRLVNKSPYVFKEYRHKLECLKLAMEEFDEIVFLDWDTKPSKKLPENFWDKLNEKEVFQSSLWSYKTPMINHRSRKENKYVPAGAFIYIRDKTIPNKIINLWETGPCKYSEQPAFALLTDEMTNGWKGIGKYWELFEPVAYHSKKSPWRFDKTIMESEDVCFINRGHPWRF